MALLLLLKYPISNEGQKEKANHHINLYQILLQLTN
jgi:hypothetical protein